MTILITAGPTREPIDPVRYLSNRSSGKMGYTLADVAAGHDHRVILISGPTDLDVPDSVDFIPVETAEEMYQAVKKYISKVDIAIFAAAVADYTLENVADQKIKKSDDRMTLTLVPTKDILGSAREAFSFDGMLIGFAAETENVLQNARKKLIKKSCDFVVANDVSRSDIGFGSDENEVTFVFKDHNEPLNKADKHDIAHGIIHRACELTSNLK